MTARSRELFGLLPVSLIVAAGFAAVLATRSEDVSDATLTYGAVFLALCLVVHLFIRARLPDADPYMFPLAALLAAVGLVVIYRIEPELAREQAQWFVVGMLFFAGTILVLHDHHVLERYRYTIAAGVDRAPGDAEAAGGRLAGERRVPGHRGRPDPVPARRVRQARHHRLPRELPARDGRHPRAPAAASAAHAAPALLFGVPTVLALLIVLVLDLTTVEIVLLAVFVASLVAVIRERPSLKHFGPLLLVWGLAMLMLIVIRDLGSSLMFFGGLPRAAVRGHGPAVDRERRRNHVPGRRRLHRQQRLARARPRGDMARHVLHRARRCPTNGQVTEFVNCQGYQIAQSLFAQADGGLFGEGFGRSMLSSPAGQSLIPAPHTDLIYAVITNEAGLFGAAGLIGAYLLFTYRGFKTAMLANDGFSKLLATGLTAVFALQVFVIVGGVTRVIPLTGVTLPFVSYGGSSIVANMVLLALLLIVSDHARAERLRRGGLV